jgi:signal peptidase I
MKLYSRKLMVLKLLLLTFIIVLPLKVFSEYYSIAVNVYYDTSESCWDRRLYVVTKGLDTKIQRSDVIYFKTPITESLFDNSNKFLKRVHGIPGDKIVAIGELLYINEVLVGQRPLLNKILELNLDKYATDFKITLAEDQYFMLGDNADYSFDSRYWGPITLDLVLGKMVY